MKKIGYIGLGKMGRNMVERLLGKGWSIVAYDALPANVALAAELGAEGVVSPQAVVEHLSSPRLIWIMVPHQAVDEVLAQVTPYLQAGDTVVDGGNSNFNETVRRGKDLAEKGIHYLDVGTSGGPGGAKDGACLMIGGEKKIYDKYEALWSDMAAPNAYAYLGASGAGHFVKMVHNGIEYGMMQAIGEGFEVLRAAPFKVDLIEAARIYNNQSVIESRLTKWLEDGLRKEGVELEHISGSVSASGEGLWTVGTKLHRVRNIIWSSPPQHELMQQLSWRGIFRACLWIIKSAPSPHSCSCLAVPRSRRLTALLLSHSVDL